MDKKELQEKIAEYYRKLPPKSQEFFAGLAWLETLREISEKYSLDENQAGILGTEAMLALLGIVHVEDFEGILKEEIKLPGELTNKIVSELNEKILAPVRLELIDAFTKNAQVREDSVGSGWKENINFIVSGK